MKVTEHFTVGGHRYILGTHRTTFAFTKGKKLSLSGDCIVGVRMSKRLPDLSDDFKYLAKKDTSQIEIIMEVGRLKEKVVGRGDNKLGFTDREDIVVRTSRFTCNRTLMVNSDKAAIDISRKIIDLMKHPDQIMIVTLTVYSDQD